MNVPIIYWIGFIVLLLLLLAFDLGVLNRKAHKPSMKEAGLWTILWISLGLLFNLLIYFVAGKNIAIDFLTGYLVEYSLSVDNIFVFVMLFAAFKVEDKYQHRVLFWGIMGALILRGLLISIGATIIHQFSWVLYIFGVFLIYAGFKMLKNDDNDVDLENNVILKFAKRFFPISNEYHEDKFMIIENGKRIFTPLFLVLIVVEFTDLLFALDSIPAIFGITLDPFIVFTSNAFAILGLRSLYFLLAGIIEKFSHLNYALAFILSFVGVKILIAEIYHIPNLASLGVIAAALVISIFTSMIANNAAKKAAG